METLVGVVSPARIGDDPNPRRDEYYFGNNYGNRIYEKGGIPLGILTSDIKSGLIICRLCITLLLPESLCWASALVCSLFAITSECWIMWRQTVLPVTFIRIIWPCGQHLAVS